MQALISDLLDFAKIQSGSLTIDAHAGNVQRIAMPVLDSLRLLAEAKGQTLQTDLPADLPEVQVDSHRLGQVLSNLVGNAIKFTPERGTIRVTARRSGNELVMSVVDTGPGISREHLSKVFDWFWQADAGKQTGSGLGLSIAKSIVEAHGGRIWAESIPGNGTSFSFTLPLPGYIQQRAA
jgi:signal transduction histidine kinase